MEVDEELEADAAPVEDRAVLAQPVDLVLEAPSLLVNHLDHIALAEPTATDPNGRVLYGLTAFSPVLKASTRRNAVYAVTNHSKDYSYNLTGKIEKRFSDNLGGSLAYTYTQAYDVQSLTSSTSGSQFRFGRVYAGRQDDLDLAHSAWETPHRFVANGTGFRARRAS